MRAGNSEKLQETLYADSLEVDKKIGLTWRLALRQPAISSAGYYRHYPQVTLVTCINTRSGRILSLDYTLASGRHPEPEASGRLVPRRWLPNLTPGLPT